MCDAAKVGVIYVWSKWNSCEYTPIKQDRSWTYYLVKPISSVNYTIFEAYDLSYGSKYTYVRYQDKWHKEELQSVQ